MTGNGFSNKEMLIRIMEKQDTHDTKLNAIHEEQHALKLEVAEIRGEYNGMALQVKRNKDDIKGIRGTAIKLATGIGGFISAVIGSVFSLMKT